MNPSGAAGNWSWRSRMLGVAERRGGTFPQSCQILPLIAAAGCCTLRFSLSLSLSSPATNPPLRSSCVRTNLPSSHLAGQAPGSIPREPPLGAAPALTRSCPPRQLLKRLQSPRESARTSQHPRFSGGGGGWGSAAASLKGRAEPAGASQGTELLCRGLQPGSGQDTPTPSMQEGTAFLKSHPEITGRTFLPPLHRLTWPGATSWCCHMLMV